MSESGHRRTELDWHQLLAAYADGELDEDTSLLVEQKLQQDPRFATELRAQQQFSPRNEQFWPQLAVPLPRPHRWEDVRNQIVRSVMDTATPGPLPRSRRSRWLRRGFIAALAACVPTASAAAIVVAAILAGRMENSHVVAFDDDDQQAGFPVTTPHDVEIDSVRHPDLGHIVVGKLPLEDALTLASGTDIQLVDVQPALDGSMPEVSTGANAPMIYAPAPARWK